MLLTAQAGARGLLSRISWGIVMGFKRNRGSIFNFTDYNQNWIPRSTTYHKSRKPRQAGWTDPNTQYPNTIPPLHPPMHPKTYLRMIELEEKEKIQRRREFLVPEIRSGDVIEITFQQTFESEDVIKYKAFVLGVKRRNSLTAGLSVIIRLSGINLQAYYPLNSPKIRNIDLVGRGSGTHKSMMKYFWDKNLLTKSSVNMPLRNKSNSRRKDDKFEGRQGSRSKKLVVDVVTEPGKDQ